MVRRRTREGRLASVGDVTHCLSASSSRQRIREGVRAKDDRDDSGSAHPQSVLEMMILGHICFALENIVANLEERYHRRCLECVGSVGSCSPPATWRAATAARRLFFDRSTAIVGLQ
jgi:hypothetical protein